MTMKVVGQRVKRYDGMAHVTGETRFVDDVIVPGTLTVKALRSPVSKGTIKTMYGVTGVPESYIVDKQGILIGKVIGARDWASPETFRFFRKLIDRPQHSTDTDTKG